MSGTINKPTAQPLIAPEQAAKLLDELVYERVVECIDFDALFGFEQELWMALGDIGVADDHIPDVTNELIGMALAKIKNDERRWMNSDAPLDDDCPLCRDLAAHEARTSKRPMPSTTKVTKAS